MEKCEDTSKELGAVEFLPRIAEENWSNANCSTGVDQQGVWAGCPLLQIRSPSSPLKCKYFLYKILAISESPWSIFSESLRGNFGDSFGSLRSPSGYHELLLILVCFVLL